MAESTPDMLCAAEPLLWHADPRLHATLSASSEARSGALTPRKDTLTVLGRARSAAGSTSGASSSATSASASGPLRRMNAASCGLWSSERMPSMSIFLRLSMCLVVSADSFMATLEASPRATMSSTFSVPARAPHSWVAPTMMGSSARAPPRTYSAAMPLGAPNLWPTTVSRSTPSCATLTGTLPTLWAASECTSTGARPRRCWLSRCTALAMAATGCRVPTSLLLCITVTSAVSSPTACTTAATSTTPWASTGTTVTAALPAACRCSRYLSTAGCSTAVVTTCGKAGGSSRPAREEWKREMAMSMAALSDSLPQEVKTTSFSDLAAMRACTKRRALSTAAREGWPNTWEELGLPKHPVMKGCMAHATSGNTGVVAL
mmetsp:Transcript_1240/g.4231  ORF Transcript_1240/g.4231 Transcript_1240/m.4231 type:complete len:377 (-) Transcript_1240:180-1310(-)